MGSNGHGSREACPAKCPACGAGCSRLRYTGRAHHIHLCKNPLCNNVW